MAYPFAPFLTLPSFIAQVKAQFGVEVKQSARVLTDPDGKSSSVFYLELERDGTKRIAIMPAVGPTKRLMPDTMRSLCNQLGIPPADFGLVLD